MTRLRLARPASGFTLVELLTVVAIIAILVAVLLPVTYNAVQAVKRSRCSNNLHSLGVAMQQFASEGGYPGQKDEGGQSVAMSPGRLPPEFGQSWAQWFRAAGLPPVMMYCPGRIRNQEVAEAARTLWPSTIDYDVPPADFADERTQFEPVENYQHWPTSLSSLAVNFRLAADKPDNHVERDGTSTGKNILYGDYSVRWNPN